MAGILALELELVGAFWITGVQYTHIVVSIAIVAFAVFLGLGHAWLRAQREPLAFGWRFLCADLAIVAGSVCLHLWSQTEGGDSPAARAAVWAITAAFLLKTPLLALACVPGRAWARTIRATSPLWLYALLTGVAAQALGEFASEKLWNSAGGAPGLAMRSATFHAVRFVLRLVYPDAAISDHTFTIGTPRFEITVSPACSGIEGLGLVLAFSLVWLWFERRRMRFPQALLLVPCALATIWLLNIARLAALFLIGEASPEIATVGFHYMAGWILFTAVALGFSLLTQNLAWVRRAPAAVTGGVAHTRVAAPAQEGGESPAILPYLAPFLAILAASFVSKAASGSFEWLYPLRFVAAAAVLWIFRDEWKRLDWRFGWLGPVIGAAVFALWIGPEFWAHAQAPSALGPALASLSPPAQWGWIAVRVAAAVVTVPIAEELAFRGYLARRIVDREFETVSYARLTLVPVAISSVVFGLMHGQHWLVGTAAGIGFALAARWRGRLGDAVAAHAVSNLLLAAWVLWRGDWGLW